jgi:SEC-C motif
MDHPDDPAAPTTMVPTSPQDLVQHLRGYEGRLPEAVRRPLVAAGASIVPALIALVEDALTDDQRDLGWAPLHAIDLLGALEDTRALPVLLRCLDLEDELDLRVEQAEAALRALGPCTLEDCVAAYAASPRDAFRDRLAGVMSQWGLHDERLYTILLDTRQRTPELGANYLVDYGDARALDVLAQTFDALPIQEGDNPLAHHVFIELRCAMEDLGGHLTAAQQQKFAQADVPRRRFVAQRHWDVDAPGASAGRSPRMARAVRGPHHPRTAGQRKLGRHAPCWCGSGKKYKQCPLPLEQGERDRERDTKSMGRVLWTGEHRGDDADGLGRLP